ncbi:MAG: hypothetical protein NZ733_03700, partial [Aigarchaeota archaeon]|nr:hypothetical protein [Aigarchaeota archaeon]
MDELVFNRRRAAYSDTAAFRFNVIWLNLVKEVHGRLLVDVLRSFTERRFVPETVFTLDGRSLVSPAEALSRYEAAISWFNSRRHLVISNGPFYLDRFDGAAQTAEIAAFRDATYPFSKGSLMGFAKEARLPTASPEGRLEVVIGSDSTLTFRATGDPGTKASVRVYEGGTGRVVFRSADVPVEGGRIRVTLPTAITSQLRRGLLVVDVSLYNPENLGVIRTFRFTTEALPAGAPPTQVTQTPGTVTAPQQPQQLPLTTVAIGVVAAIVAVTAVLLVMLRRRKGS